MLKTANSLLLMLESAGYEARIAGGAVRDILSGVEPKDIDIATTAKPDEVVDFFQNKIGWRVIATGLQHGTVTVVANGIPFEITTLRIDRESDGRWATVEFTNDWIEDARRRDFTFNAMFMDRHGAIFDYFNGHDDLKANIVRFVGNAEDRIREDYLRIMRYFRFLTKMKTVVYDVKTLNTIANMVGGLDKISGERIWMELKKILSAKNSFTAIKLMAHTVGKQIGLTNNPDYLDYRDFNNDHPVLIKAVELFNRSPDVIDVMKNRYKASTQELDYVKTFFFLNNSKTTFYDIMVHCEKHYDDIVEICNTGKAINAKVLQEEFQTWGKPMWPVSGADLINEGMHPGKELGMELVRRRKRYAEFYHYYFLSE